MAAARAAELVFVVDVTSFTERGFVGTTTYEGENVGLEFDDSGAGVFLTAEMARRLSVKSGSYVSVSVEDGAEVIRLKVSGIGKGPRVSDQKVYYAVGREGGAILRIRKAQ